MNSFVPTNVLILIFLLMAYFIEMIATDDRNGKISKIVLLFHVFLLLILRDSRSYDPYLTTLKVKVDKIEISNLNPSLCKEV